MDTRAAYYKHIVLSGGSSMFPGLPSRLEKNITDLYCAEVCAARLLHTPHLLLGACALSRWLTVRALLVGSPFLFSFFSFVDLDRCSRGTRRGSNISSSSEAPSSRSQHSFLSLSEKEEVKKTRENGVFGMMPRE